MSASPLPQQPAPVEASRRIGSLDTLRGVAVLGILVMNIYFFAMPMPAYMNPLIWGGTELHNIATWFVTHALFDQKFLSIFAMLFGAGIVLMTGRAEKQTRRARRIYFRRQFWLIVIGLLHAYLLWHGDILFAYAFAGLIAFLFRHLSPRKLLIAACLLLPVTAVFNVLFSYQFEQLSAQATAIRASEEAGLEIDADARALLERWELQRDIYQPSPEVVQEEIAAFKGSYPEIFRHRDGMAALFQFGAIMIFSWRFVALMLIGMALFKLDVLTARRSPDFYRGMMIACYAIGLPMTVYSGMDLYARGFDALYIARVGGIPNYVGSVIVALGHIALVMLILKTGYLERLMARFAAVGRMALTNYLMHSAILTTVFYGYGLGLFGEVQRFAQMGFVAGVIGLQLVLSPWWLARYRFGPVEWLWRSLTYWRRQPLAA